MVDKPSFHIFGCGGCGVNITKQFQHQVKNDNPYVVSYVDTSRSNMDEENIERSYLIDGVNGSGKKRSLNAEAIGKNMAPLLAEYTPGDFNIVVFSASGGTGSTAGPILMHSLLSRNKNTVAVISGDSDSAISIENTINTLKSLSALSEKIKQPINVVYAEMGDGSQRRVVDDVMKNAIEAIRVLASGNNHEMDSQDLVHWLNYSEVTTHHPGLGLLQIHNTNDNLDEFYGALSVASLYASPDEEHAQIQTAYHTVGYTDAHGTTPLHFILSQEGLMTVMESLERKAKEYGEQARELSAQHVSLHDAGSVGDDFMQY